MSTSGGAGAREGAVPAEHPVWRRRPLGRSQYEGGTTDVELVAPDGWTFDQHFFDRPERQRAQVALALD